MRVVAAIDRRVLWRLALLLILLAGFALRIGFIDRDLPDVYHPDEPTNMGVLFAMLQGHDLNPHFFNYPSLFFYLNALPYLPGMLLGHLGGLLPVLPSAPAVDSVGLGINHAPHPWVFEVSRLLTLFVSLGGAILLYCAAYRLTAKRSVATLAAALLILSPTYVENSVLITPDVWATVAVIGVFYVCVRLDATPSRRLYVIAGAAVGIAMSLKYNAVLSGVMVMVVAVHHRQNRILDWRGLGAIPAALAAFLLTTPFAIFDPHAFIHGAGSEIKHYRTGHAGMEGGALQWYADYLWRTETVVVVLAMVSLLLARRRMAQSALVWSFVVVYGASVANLAVRNSRTILLIIPFLCVAGAILVEELAAKARASDHRRFLILPAMALAVLVAGVGFSVTDAVDDVDTAHKTDNRALAQRWIAANVPIGSSIMTEAYGPWVDKQQYRVKSVFSLDQADPADLTTPQNVNFVFTSETMHGRYAADPKRYGAELAGYERAYATLTPVAHFGDGAGSAIDIYRVG